MAGQINRGSEMGEIIYNLAQDTQYKNYVEIGTWNGEGSSFCFWSGLSNRNDQWQFFSFEANRSFYDQAVSFFGDKKDPRFNLIYGRIIDIEDMYDLDSPLVRAHFEDHVHKEIYPRFFYTDLEAFKGCKNQLHILDKIDIDILLLDGGEFSTFAEFNILKSKTKIIILDDTKEFKTKRAYEELLGDPNWNCEIASNTRSGFSVHKKK